MPLAYQCGTIAFGTKQLGKREAIRVNEKRIICPDCRRFRPRAKRVSSGHQVVPRRCANRRWRMGICEATPVPGERIDVRRGCLRGPVASLTYRFQGRDFRLTDLAGNVVKEILK